jgi:hypothetical protein
VHLELQMAQRQLAETQGRLSVTGIAEQAKAIARLQAANSQLEADLRANQDALTAIQKSLTPHRLSPEERSQLTEVLAQHDGQQFGVISVTTGPGCQECMLYRNEIVQAITSIPGWQASGDIDMAIKPDLTGIFIGVKDSKTPPLKANIIAHALKAAKLPFKLGIMNRLSPDDSILIIGNKP